jgi:hypothetical protein
MLDDPRPAEILQSVAALLREDILPLLTGNPAFQLRVAANAIDLVRREISVSAQQDFDELEGLHALLGREGSVAELNVELARRVANRTVDLETPGFVAFLWSTTEAKLAVDQPNYAGLRRAKALLAAQQQES